MIDISVAVCTWNRAQSLDNTLNQMLDLRVPDGAAWELLIVNNNCTDRTDEIISKYQTRLPIRRLFESKPGQSHARNLAIDAARGELLVWTDDDVRVHADWLVEYWKAAATWPDAGYFGGKIIPWYEHTPPSWVIHHQRELQGMLVIRDLQSQERQFVEGESPFGANMAFRRSAISDMRFNTNLGRVGLGNITGDETEFIGRLRTRGQQGVWVPSAEVEHWVSASRLQVSYLYDYYFGTGQTSVRLQLNSTEDASPRFMGIPRWILRRWLEASFASLWKRVTHDQNWPLAMVDKAIFAGMITEHHRRREAFRQPR